MKKEKEFLHAGALKIDQALQYYYPESDPLVQERLNKWQGVKFGLLMHWAPSSQWGVVESWSLCSEDEEWCKRKIENYCEYKKQYENLKNTFNPVKFDPDKWADAAASAGMKYMIFTTKHHDGFCMYDSNFTDYKITSKECPFHTNPKANIAKEIFDAFRKRDFMIGAYFSKPDWHSDYFWWQRFATPDRNVNYDIEKYPERWQIFVEFTYNQVDELVSNYGNIDILWFDGCWVRAYTEEELAEERKKLSFNIQRVQNQDINMSLIAENARHKQPGIIVVDRAVFGPHQNYLTPENQIPDKVLPYPWETCMPITPSWSYAPGLEYKSTRQIIHHLVDIVAKGGNFLLNVAPTPEGDFEDETYVRLREIGSWTKINGEAIYESKPFQPYKEGNVCFTQKKDGTVYAIYLVKNNEKKCPDTIVLKNFCPLPDSKMKILGIDGYVSWEKSGKGCKIKIPAESLNANYLNLYAWTLKIVK